MIGTLRRKERKNDEGRKALMLVDKASGKLELPYLACLELYQTTRVEIAWGQVPASWD